MAENKGQHVVPRFYLAYFTDSDGLVHVWDRVQCKFLPRCKPEKVGKENDCYTVVTNGVREMAADKVNNDVETFCASHLAALTSSGIPTTEEWQAISSLTANLLTRSRRIRDSIVGPKNDLIERLGKNGGWDFITQLDPRMADTKEVLERDRDVTHAVVVGAGIEPMLDELKGKPCQLLVAPPGSRFTTSDDPVLLLKDKTPVDFRFVSGFLRDPSISVFLPLKPDLACCWGIGPELKKLLLTADEVIQYNRLMFQRAYRQVFAADARDLDQFRSLP